MTKKSKKYIYTPLWVRIITISLFIFFLLVGIITIIYIQGNVINVKEREIISTGSIRINANTNSFKVYLNNEEHMVNDSQINSIKPGEYILRVEKQGYSSFETVVEVTEGLITSTNVQLFPEDVLISDAINIPVSKIKFDQKNSIAIYITAPSNNLNSEVKRKSFNNSLFSLVSSDETSITKAGSEIYKLFNNNFDSIVFSPTASYVLIKDTQDSYYIVPIDANLTQVPLATAYELNIDFEVDRIEWLSDSKLIILSGSVLFQYDVKTTELTLIDLNQTEYSYKTDISKEKVYFLRKSQVYVYANNKSSLFQLPLDETTTLEELTNETVEFANDNILITSTSQKLYFFQLDYKTYGSMDKIDLLIFDLGGKNIIGEINDTLVGIQLLETPTARSIQLKSNQLGKSRDEINLKSTIWANDASFFLYKLSLDNQTLYSSDPQATRSIAVFESSIEEIQDDFLIASNKESILLVTKSLDPLDTSLSVKRLEIK